MPQVSELAAFLHVERFDRDRRAARLARAADVWDLRTIARRRTPKPAFDYADGGAGREHTLARNRAAFDAIELCPPVLHGTAEVDLSVTIAGGPSALPFGIGPTGFTRFLHAEGEDAGSVAAARAGIPFTLSTMGTRSIEDVAAMAPSARRWFQLYLWRDRVRSRDLLDRAWANGYDTVMVTVDTPVAGQRLRDARNGMTIPPRIRLRTLAEVSYRPRWWFDLLTTDALSFASLSPSSTDLPTLINSMFDPSQDFSDLAWVRSVWPGQLFVKGVLTAPDARRSVDAGADGVIVSNHGGRQLDHLPASLTALPEVRRELGPRVPVILDSGVMSGADVIAALCCGADFVLLGRAYLYGLMAGGRQGVSRALTLLSDEVRVGMQLMGAARIDDLDRSLVRAPWLA